MACFKSPNIGTGFDLRLCAFFVCLENQSRDVNLHQSRPHPSFRARLQVLPVLTARRGAGLRSTLPWVLHCPRAPHLPALAGPPQAPHDDGSVRLRLWQQPTSRLEGQSPTSRLQGSFLSDLHTEYLVFFPSQIHAFDVPVKSTSTLPKRSHGPGQGMLHAALLLNHITKKRARIRLLSLDCFDLRVVTTVTHSAHAVTFPASHIGFSGPADLFLPYLV
jgi:hypothetical protein